MVFLRERGLRYGFLLERDRIFSAGVLSWVLWILVIYLMGRRIVSSMFGVDLFILA